MKKLCFWFLLVTLSLLPSCSNVEPCESKTLTNANAVNVISKETAILIAKGAADPSYRLEEYVPIVIDRGDTWMIGFDFKSEDKEKYIVGGAPTIVIEKRNGNIVSMSATK